MSAQKLSKSTLFIIAGDFWWPSPSRKATRTLDLSSVPLFRAATTALTLGSTLAMVLSISAISIRTPLILTWVSARPRYRNEPSISWHTKSPVRYNREHTPRIQAGLSRKALRVISGRFRYPRAKVPPATSSPIVPIGASREMQPGSTAQQLPNSARPILLLSRSPTTIS